MKILVLQLDAPLMSFGGVRVDNFNPTEEVPMASLLTGLVANALGYDHSEYEATSRLQERIQYSARVDRPGRIVEDFHTVDLGQEHLSQPGWTTWGIAEEREGGSSEGTHIRHRTYHGDRVVTVAVALRPVDEEPTLLQVRDALQRPARPLFIGRKCCIPSLPLVMMGDKTPGGFIEAESTEDALRWAPVSKRGTVEHFYEVWTPSYDDGVGAILWRDRKDWVNQIHGDRRYMHRKKVSSR